VVALFLHESEAQFALTVHQELAQKKYQEQQQLSLTHHLSNTGLPTYTIRAVEKE
jgi:hypothetical protein